MAKILHWGMNDFDKICDFLTFYMQIGSKVFLIFPVIKIALIDMISLQIEREKILVSSALVCCFLASIFLKIFKKRRKSSQLID
jgi:hypothetical protein